jgi:hypothetical protein
VEEGSPLGDGAFGTPASCRPGLAVRTSSVTGQLPPPAGCGAGLAVWVVRPRRTLTPSGCLRYDAPIGSASLSPIEAGAPVDARRKDTTVTKSDGNACIRTTIVTALCLWVTAVAAQGGGSTKVAPTSPGALADAAVLGVPVPTAAAPSKAPHRPPAPPNVAPLSPTSGTAPVSKDPSQTLAPPVARLDAPALQSPQEASLAAVPPSSTVPATAPLPPSASSATVPMSAPVPSAQLVRHELLVRQEPLPHANRRLLLVPRIGLLVSGDGKLELDGELDYGDGSMGQRSRSRREYADASNPLLAFDLLYAASSKLRYGGGVRLVPSSSIELEGDDGGFDVGTDVSVVAVVEPVFRFVDSSIALVLHAEGGVVSLFSGGDLSQEIDDERTSCENISACSYQNPGDFFWGWTLGLGAGVLLPVGAATLRADILYSHYAMGGVEYRQVTGSMQSNYQIDASGSRTWLLVGAEF